MLLNVDISNFAIVNNNFSNVFGFYLYTNPNKFYTFKIKDSNLGKIKTVLKLIFIEIQKLIIFNIYFRFLMESH